jgi:hypothetical protein
MIRPDCTSGSDIQMNLKFSSQAPKVLAISSERRIIQALTGGKMRSAVIGNPNIYWPDFILAAENDPLPYWPHREVCAFNSPCRTRSFMALAISSTGKPDTGRSIAVEYLPNDPLLLELELGGGITWADYFMDHEKLLLIDTVIFGPSQSSLVDGHPYHKQIEEILGPLGNTGAWDLYRKWVEEALVEIEWLWSGLTRKERRQRETIPAAFEVAYAKRFPGKKSA